MTRGELLQPDRPPSQSVSVPETDGALSPPGPLPGPAVEGGTVAVAHCVRRGGRHTEAALLGRLVDGIELGQTAADLEERGSPLLPAQLEVCAAAFGLAAQSCARFPEDPVLAWCGQTCGSAAASLSG